MSYCKYLHYVYTYEIKDLLLKFKLYRNQFHDVLPGSSIEMVYDDANKV